MESHIYSSLGSKIKKSYKDGIIDDLLTLKDFLSNKFVIRTELELKKIFVRDLKKVLMKENIFDLIQSFFDLETELQHASEKIDFDKNLINFDEFYKNLSPVFMRALLENSSQSSNAEAILKSLREALRIALEEELANLVDIEV